MPPKGKPSHQQKKQEPEKCILQLDSVDSYIKDYFEIRLIGGKHIKFPKVDKFIKLKEDLSILSYDLIFEFFRQIYDNIIVIDYDVEMKYFNSLVSGYENKYKEAAVLTDIKRKTLIHQLLSSQIESKRDIEDLYHINHQKATDIIIFNQSVITDIHFGKKHFDSIRQNEFCELLDIYDSSKEQFDLYEKKLLENEINFTFTRLFKYYYYVMYLFQKKLSNYPINQYNQIRFFDFFKKLNQKITIQIVKIFDQRFDHYYNRVLMNERTIGTIQATIYETVFGKHNDEGLIHDTDKIRKGKPYDKKTICKYFNTINYILIDLLVLTPDFIDIFYDMIISYNVLIYLLETNTQTDYRVKGVGEPLKNKYNRFIKVFNNFNQNIAQGGGKNNNNKDENIPKININLEEEVNLEAPTRPMTPITPNENEISEISKDLVNDFSSSTYKKLVKMNRETLMKMKSQRDQRIKESYCQFLNVDDISKSVILGNQIFQQKKAVYNHNNDIGNDLFNEKGYHIINQELMKSKSKKDKVISIKIDPSGVLVYYVPKYVPLSNSFYEKYNEDYDLKRLDINFNDNNATNISIYDFFVFRYKKFLIKFITYHIKFIYDTIDLYNSKLLPKKSEQDIYKEYRVDIPSKLFQKEDIDKVYFQILYIDFIGAIKFRLIGQEPNKINLNTIQESNAYNDRVYVLLTEPYIQSKLTRYYNINYNFSKLSNDFALLKRNYFDISRIDSTKLLSVRELKYNINDSHSHIHSHSHSLSLNNSSSNYFDVVKSIISYLDFLVKNQELVKMSEVIKKKKGKVKIIRSTTSTKTNEEVLLNLSNIDSIVNNIGSKNISKNERILININTKNIIFNYLLHLLKQYKSSIYSNFGKNSFLNTFMNVNSYKNLIECLFNNLHNEFVLNILFPLIFDIFVIQFNKSCPIVIKSKTYGKQTSTSLPTYSLQDIYQNLLNNIDVVQFTHMVFLNGTIDNQLICPEFIYINLLLFILYSNNILSNYYTPQNYWKKRLLISQKHFKDFYTKIYDPKVIKLPEIEQRIEIISLEEFKKKYYKSIASASNEKEKPISTIEVKPIIREAKQPITKGKEQVKSISLEDIKPINKEEVKVSVKNTGSSSRSSEIVVSKKIKPIIIETERDELYSHLLDENLYLNRSSRIILNNWILVNEKRISLTSKNKDILGEDSHIIKRLLIYENKFILARVAYEIDRQSSFLDSKDIHYYTFLYSKDIHYTIIKYSKIEDQSYKTCGAYAHLTIKICQENMPGDRYSLYDMLLEQVSPPLTEERKKSIRYITLHYGNATLIDEYYNMRPNMWININFTKEEYKMQSIRINTDILYVDYGIIIEFIRNLYNFFIEYVKSNPNISEYYLNPNCTGKKGRIRFIDNYELM